MIGQAAAAVIERQNAPPVLREGAGQGMEIRRRAREAREAHDRNVRGPAIAVLAHVQADAIGCRDACFAEGGHDLWDRNSGWRAGQIICQLAISVSDLSRRGW